MTGNDKLNRARAERLCNEGGTLRRERRYDEALDKYAAAIQADPTYDGSYFGMAMVYDELEDPVTALIKLDNAFDAGAKTSSLLLFGGDILRRAGRHDEAIAAYESALDMEADLPDALSGIGACHWLMGNADKALSLLDQALSIDSRYPLALAYKAKIAEARGNFDDALRLFEAAEWTYEAERLRSRLNERDLWTSLPTVQMMLEYLRRFVQGQERAKIDLATAVYNHYLSLAWQDDNVLNTDLGRHNILLLGPSGSGKTYMIELLTKKLNVPLAMVSATSLVQTGYVGKKIDSIIADLVVAAQFDVAKAERGIVFIDEIDKVRQHGGSGPDVSGEGVQEGLLTMLEGRPVRVEFEYRGAFTVDTSKVLFIAAGAFAGIEETVRRRLGSGSLGFGAGASRRESSRDCYGLVNTDDLEAYGMMPQFLGRFSSISSLETLTRDDLRIILTSIEDSLLKKQQKLFALHGIELVLTDDAIEAILDHTSAAKTGARGLRNAIATALRPVAWRLDALSSSGVSEVRITDESVRNAAEPLITSGTEVRETAPEVSRLRNAVFNVLRGKAGR